jgi:hypothetical protein
MKNSTHTDCPSCSNVTVPAREAVAEAGNRLSHWPIQIKLIGTVAPFLNNADLLVAADCTGFATPNFQQDFLKNRKVLIGCPKLDDSTAYVDKFSEIFSNGSIQKVTCLRMEVPCCGGMTVILREAIKRSGKNIHLDEIIIGVKGDQLSNTTILG